MIHLLVFCVCILICTSPLDVSSEWLSPVRSSRKSNGASFLNPNGTLISPSFIIALIDQRALQMFVLNSNGVNVGEGPMLTSFDLSNPLSCSSSEAFRWNRWTHFPTPNAPISSIQEPFLTDSMIPFPLSSPTSITQSQWITASDPLSTSWQLNLTDNVFTSTHFAALSRIVFTSLGVEVNPSTAPYSLKWNLASAQPWSSDIDPLWFLDTIQTSPPQTNRLTRVFTTVIGSKINPWAIHHDSSLPPWLYLAVDNTYSLVSTVNPYQSRWFILTGDMCLFMQCYHSGNTWDDQQQMCI